MREYAIDLALDIAELTVTDADLAATDPLSLSIPGPSWIQGPNGCIPA